MKRKFLKFFACLFIAVYGTSAFAIEVSVKDFGAKGDGKTDDRQSVQFAIDAINKAGGGIVNFPEGVYILTAPNKLEWAAQIKLCNNLKFRGAGINNSIIKIADSQGAYDVIFTGDSITDFSMVDITIDGNGATNPVVSSKDAVSSPFLHSIIYLPNARNIAIQRCRFTNLSGVWAVYALHRAENILIDACVFDNIGGYTLTDWDHSCIRIDGYGPIVVSNNSMTSRFGSGTTGARTAIELHGSNIKFNNNRISGFRYGINVCSGGDGKLTEASVHQYYTDNTFTNVGSGFCIWGIDNHKLDDLVFERNSIIIDVTGWKNFFPNFSGIEIISYAGQEPPEMLENLRIINNHIAYLNTEGGTNRSFGMNFDFSVFNSKSETWMLNKKGEIKNVKISGNTISGAYWTAMYFNCVAKDVEISDNIIIESAKGIGVGDREWQYGIKISNRADNVRLLNNTFYVQKPISIIAAVYDDTRNAGKCIYFKNRILGAGSKGIPLYLTSPLDRRKLEK